MRKITVVWLVMLMLIGGMMSGVASCNHWSEHHEVNNSLYINYYEKVEDYPATYDKNTNNIINPGWYKTWGGTDYDISCDVVVNDGFVYTTGYTESYGTDNISDVCLLKYDTNGNFIWNRSWGGTSHDYGFSISVDAGYIYVTGDTYLSGAEEEMCLLKYDTDGNLIWNRTWGGAKQDEGYSIIVDTVGYIYVIGRTENYGAGDYDVFLLKYDANGNLIWNKTWGGINYERGYSATIESEYIYITGTTKSYGAGCKDIFLLKYDTNGNQIWNKTWGGTNQDEGYSVAVDAEYIYITGYTYSWGGWGGDYDVCLLKYDTDGNLIWDKTWGVSSFERGYGVAVDAGYIYITGYTYSYGAGDYDVCLLKYDTTGNLTWYKTWGGNGNDGGYGIFVDSTGYIYITGYTESYTVYSCDMFLLKCDLNGGCGGYAPHDTIYIYSNSDFTSVNGVTSGNGTADNPFIIENWDINASSANGIHIENTSVYFVIRNCYLHDGSNNYDGIHLYNLTHGKVEDVISWNNCYGFCLLQSSNNIITNCAAYNNYYKGIYLLDHSKYNIITNSTLYGSPGGINLAYYCSGNNIIECTVYQNGDGIGFLHYSSTNNIVDCIIYDNNDDGVYLQESSSCIITNCTLYNNSGSGIHLQESSDITITNCDIYNNWFGIYLCWYPSSNQISNCAVYNNVNGICLDCYSNNNSIYHNNFINNTYQANDSCINHWDNDSEGNYWSDYIGIDEDGDGIGDIPYNLSGGNNKDNYPLMVPWNITVNQPPIVNITYPKEGQTVNGTVTISGTAFDPDSGKLPPHAPIYINGNANFTSEKGVVSGSGTESDPYIVEGWDIDASTAHGIYIENTDVYFTIRNCMIHDGKDNDKRGTYFYHVTNGKIENCTIYNNYWSGIYLLSSSNNTITSNQIYNNSWYGIYLSSSSNNNSITGNQIYSNRDYGIFLYPSSNNTITSNQIYNNSCGIFGCGSSNNNITSNQIYNNSNSGFYFYDSSNNNIITSNHIYNNNDDGIFLEGCSNNDISSNQIYNNSNDGLYLYRSPNNNLNCNQIYNNSGYGIYLSHSSHNNIITGNQIYNNSHGIYLYYNSANNILRNNVLENNTYNFGVYGSNIWYYYQDIDTSNKINGRPIYYIIEQNNLGFDGIEAGYLGVVSCSNISVKNLTLTNNHHGLLLANTSYSTITSSQISNNSYYGIYLVYSSNNNLSGNQIYNNSYGISLDYSSNNNITSNQISNNDHGIYLISSSNNNLNANQIYNNHNYGTSLKYSSNNNVITSNQIYNNSDSGVYLRSSSDNEIHYNNIYNNTNYGVYNYNSESQYIGNATYNWWGSADGSYHPDTNPDGTGDNVTDNVLYDPWLTEPVEIAKNRYRMKDYKNTPIEKDRNLNGATVQFIEVKIDDGDWQLASGTTSWSFIWDTTTVSNGWHMIYARAFDGADYSEIDSIGVYVDNPISELTPHEPIYINDNDDFTLENGVVSGSGTESNPYIIEGYDIDAGTASYPSYAGVRIQNTDAYFIIRNCVIHDGYEEEVRYNYGIYFYNVTNGKIENVTSYHNSYGLSLYYSPDSMITNCTIYNNSWFGGSLYYSPNSTITRCVFYNNSYYGIELYDSSNSTVTNCTIYNNSYGIGLACSLNCKVENCTVYNHTWGGILVSSQSSNNRIANCAVYNSSYCGIQISSSVWNTVINCSVYNNSRYGIYFSYSQYNQIANSLLYNNTDYNIYLSSSLGDQVTNCVLYNSNYGAYLYSCLYDQISECTFYNNRYRGIYFTSSLYNQITNDSVINCSTGIYFSFSFYNQITNCALNNNSYSGGYFQFSSNNTVTRCNISVNNCGIYLYSQSNNNYIYHNSFINNTNNAYDECANYWDYNGEGNYWSDYNGTDENGDGIGDSLYNISGGSNKDNYPLIHEFAQWDKEPPTVTIIEQSQTITTTSFTLHWSTNATDIQYFEISTDGINWVNVGTNTSYTFTNLIEGNNILYVRGTDLANNTGASSSLTITVEISEEITYGKEEVNWLLYGGIIVAIFIVLMLAGIGITGMRKVKRRKVFYPQKLKCIYCQETTRATSPDRPLLFQCPKCGGKSVIR